LRQDTELNGCPSKQHESYLDVRPENGVTLDFSRPGKPTDNAFLEAVNV
jgi:transposase InsO family protein